MLTSCSECGTTFRISSAELRLAEGLARCGSCGATFNALLTLSDDSAPPQPAPDDDSGEHDAGWIEPPPGRAGVGERLSGTTRAAAGTATSRALPQAEAHDAPEADDARPGGWDIGDTVEQPAPMRTETDDEEAGTPIYLIDDWAADQAASALDRPSEAPELAGPAAETFNAPDGRTTDQWPEDEPRGFYFEDGEARAARAWRPAREPPDEPDFAAPAPPRRRSGAWGLGAMLLMILLGAQLVHAQRDALATHPGYGQLVRTVYAALDLALYPAWPLSAYQITESEAVVAGGTTRGALDILGTIAVKGSDAVGAPLVRVTLRDRWSNALGERLVDAREYASEKLRRETLLRPGSTLPLQISLMDPGAEAIGYELDICIRYRRLGLRCQVDADPFVQ